MIRSLFSKKNPKEVGGVSPEARIVFMAINKTGSSSIWTWLDQHDIAYYMNRYQEDEKRKLAVISQTKERQLPSFTIVRNPWERAVSSWKWCMVKKGMQECTFEEFLRTPFEEMTEQQRFHTSPQYEHIVDADGNSQYLSHVGRLESIQDTCDWIAETLAFTPIHQLPHLKQTNHSRYTEYYDDTTRELVERIFREDIVRFGYEFGS